MTVAEAISVQAARFRQVLSYDPETGEFIRIERQGRMKAGTRVGAINALGYVTVTIDRKRFGAHRLAWFFVHGRWPEGDIDHINGNRADNRIANLRDVSRSQNNQNRRIAQRNNSASGLLGVYWHKQRQKWRAQIQIDGKSKSLGLFEDKDGARLAYEAAKRVLHPYWAENANVG